jgi:DNA polymerase
MSAEQSVNLTAQLLAHLQSLKASGVLFMPRGEPLPLPTLIPVSTAPAPAPRLAPEPVAASASPVVSRDETPSLFAQPAAIPDSPEGRRKALTLLAGEVSGCDLCGELFSTRTQTVFGVGPIDPEVAFVGEAPGADEDRLGEPFVGRAGQLLDRIIVRCGFARRDVYIFNTLKCRPPNNRQPTPSECANCRPFFERQFDLVRPKYVVAVGAVAAKNLLQTTEGIGLLRGKVYEYRKRPLICTYHPSALLRDVSKTKWWECWEDMKLLLKTMGRLIPDDRPG